MNLRYHYVTLRSITVHHATLHDMNSIASIANIAETPRSYMNASRHACMHGLQKHKTLCDTMLH